MGLNRRTVTRYIREYEASIREDPEEGLEICLASKPKYPARNVERTRMTEPVCAEIEYWLQENAKRRQTGMRKQCLKKQDIHRVLIEKYIQTIRDELSSVTVEPYLPVSLYNSYS